MSEAAFGVSTIGYPYGLTHKHQTRQERPSGGKHSSLLRAFVTYDRKIFYSNVPRGKSYISFYLQLTKLPNKLEYLIPGRAFQPCLTFESKAGACLSGFSFVLSTLGQAPGLIRKQQGRITILARDEHFSLFSSFVSYKEKRFMILTLILTLSYNLHASNYKL